MFVLTEKSLTSRHDGLDAVTAALRHTSGSAMYLVERYADVTVAPRQYLRA
ncbi:hypothetical protein GTY65_00100 [Streptomyces sp. SID8379]|uniref:hypothetical protein n=1 Tax=unclassified Streptomyces TaxID=2593676 RepID=UPI000364B520|nr:MULTISPECIES: hypothetical protein [unclassified Streptomyces]MYW62492.1 hypothetical protein [Streptomyces sp. SID8379]